MSEEVKPSDFSQDKDFDYSPLNSQNSASDSLNNYAGQEGEPPSTSEFSQSEPSQEINKRKEGHKCTSFPITAVISIAVAVFLIGFLLKIFLSNHRENVVYEAARMAPRDSVAIVAVDLRQEDNLSNLFGGLLQGMAGSSVLKNQLSQILPEEINFDLIKDLALHTEGAGALIARFPNKENPGLCVYMQKFKAQAPLEQTMQKFQEISLKKNPGLKYATITTQNGLISCPASSQRGFSWLIQGSTLFIATSGQDIQTILEPREEEDSLLADPGFQKCLGQIDKNGLIIGFVNFQRFSQGTDLGQLLKAKGADTGFIKLLEALQYGFFKGQIARTKAGKEIAFSAQLVGNPQKVGDFAKAFLNKNNNIDFKSLKYHPSTNSSLISLNLKTLWKLTYELMGLTPEGRKQRQQPDEMLRRVGSSMDKLLDMLTGELTLSIDGLSRIQGEQFVNSSSSNVYKAAKMPIVVTLGLKNSGDFEAFLLNLPSVPLLVAMCPSYDINNCRVYKIPLGRNTFLTITDDQLVAAFNMESQSAFDDILSGKAEKTWTNIPLIKRIAQEGRLRGVFFSCEDIKANREDTAAGIRSRLSVAAPQDRELLEVLCKTLDTMSRTMGYGYSVVSWQEDGCLMEGASTLTKSGLSAPTKAEPEES